MTVLSLEVTPNKPSHYPLGYVDVSVGTLYLRLSSNYRFSRNFLRQLFYSILEFYPEMC